MPIDEQQKKEKWQRDAEATAEAMDCFLGQAHCYREAGEELLAIIVETWPQISKDQPSDYVQALATRIRKAGNFLGWRVKL